MATLTYSIEIDSTKYRYLTQEPDGTVWAHINIPTFIDRTCGWDVHPENSEYITTGAPNIDTENSLVDMRKTFTFSNGILKQTTCR